MKSGKALTGKNQLSKQDAYLGMHNGGKNLQKSSTISHTKLINYAKPPVKASR